MTISVPRTASVRPAAVRVAYALYLTGFLIDLAVSIAPPASGTDVAKAMIRAALMVSFATQMWKGRNWARITLTVLTGLSVVADAVIVAMLASAGVSFASEAGLILTTVLTLALLIAGMIATYAPASNTFFRAVKAARRRG